MTATQVLQWVRAEGFHLRVSDGKLLVSPASKLTDEMRDVIREHRPALAALILAERLTAAIHAATLARGDTEDNRRELLAEVLALPAAQQLDLAEHFEAVTRIWQAACRGVVP